MAWGDPIDGYTFDPSTNTYVGAGGQRLASGSNANTPDPTGQPASKYSPTLWDGSPNPAYAGPGYSTVKGSMQLTDPGANANWQAQNQRDLLAQTTGTATANQPTMQTANASGYDAGQGGVDQAYANQANNPDTIAGRQAPTVDTTQTDAARQARDAALADQRRVLEATLNTGVDPVEQKALEQRAFEQGLTNANTVASNARGGAGAVAAARMQVNQQMPQLAGQAASSAAASETALLNARIQKASTAGSIANTIGQTATGAFGQEASLATDTAQIGLQTIDRAIADTGQHITASLQVQQQLGAMINDLNQLGLNYAALDEKTQESIMDDLTKRYGIDQATYAAIRTASINKKTTPLQWITGIAGAVSGVVGAVGTMTGGGAKPPAAPT